MVFPIASYLFAKCLRSRASLGFFPIGFQSFTRLPLFDTKGQLPLVQTEGTEKAKDSVQLGALRELGPKKIVSRRDGIASRLSRSTVRAACVEKKCLLAGCPRRGTPKIGAIDDKLSPVAGRFRHSDDFALLVDFEMIAADPVHPVVLHDL